MPTNDTQSLPEHEVISALIVKMCFRSVDVCLQSTAGFYCAAANRVLTFLNLILLSRLSSSYSFLLTQTSLCSWNPADAFSHLLSFSPLHFLLM